MYCTHNSKDNSLWKLNLANYPCWSEPAYYHSLLDPPTHVNEVQKTGFFGQGNSKEIQPCYEDGFTFYPEGNAGSYFPQKSASYISMIMPTRAFL